MMRYVYALSLGFLMLASAQAQTAGMCSLGIAERDLDASDVLARMFNTGSLFFGNTTTNGTGYLVPIAEGRSPMFAAGVWIGGQVNGALRVAGSRYTRFEFWPGPLDPGGVLPEPDCRHTNANGREAWDRIYAVSLADVAAYEQGGSAPADLLDWPVGLGAPAVDAGGAPVVPTSRDQLIDLAAGERPVLFGSQTAFWVMNDVGNDHEETGSDPIGLEVQVMAFSIVDADPAFGQGTFYRYRVINRSSAALTDAYLSVFADPDLGNPADDYVGADPARGMTYVYNGDDIDDPGSNGYGTPPALGIDLFDEGADAITYFCNGCPEPATTDPRTKEEYYNHMQGLWKDGVPLTAAGTGYQTAGAITSFAFPGNPVTSQCWSMVNDCLGNAITPTDQRMLVHSPSFTLAAGEAQDFHFGILFAQGSNRFDSIGQLRAASDRVQGAFDDGSLFTRGDTPTELGQPTATAPAEGELITDTDPVLVWTAVPGADAYAVRWATTPDFSDAQSGTSSTTSFVIGRGTLPANAEVTVYWEVRALASGASGPYSETASFRYFRFLGEWLAEGDGIIEVAYPGVPGSCPDPSNPSDYGCTTGLPGNTAWHDGNVNDDYYITGANTGTSCTPLGEIGCLSRYIEAAVPDDFEIRFTDAGGYAVYGFEGDGAFSIARVPFEVWNVGFTPDDPADDVRMIPFLNPATGTTALSDWSDSYRGTDVWAGSPCPGGCPTADWIYGMMPDRLNGYALFEQAAIGFGGAGADYIVSSDGDTQIDLDPLTASACENQGVYVDYCYHNQAFANNAGNPSQFIYPLGRLVFADLARDGTTPPSGTTIRLVTTKPTGVASEPGGPDTGLPAAYLLHPVYPNPFNPRAVVPFSLPSAASVRVAVYDVLGREVAVLVNERLAAGTHQAVFDGTRLASGLYVVTFDADGVRQGHRRVTLLR